MPPLLRFLFPFLSFLFALRVLGQAVQHWLPQPFLPAFDQFQGSSLMYPLLLSIQLLILALMLQTSWQAWHGRLVASRRWGKVWAACGGVYMLGSLLRIAIGLTVPDIAPWFRAWIPAFFHVVLAAFVLTLAAFHLQASSGEE